MKGETNHNKKKTSIKDKIKSMNPGFKQLLIKTGIFLGVFILFSLIIGQKIVTSSLLEGFKISIYGGLGYILLFSVVGFIVLYRNRLSQLKGGKFKKKHGKIMEIDVKNTKLKIEGITIKKRDGSNANIKMQPSNLQITELNLDDKKRIRTSANSSEKQLNERMKTVNKEKSEKVKGEKK